MKRHQSRFAVKGGIVEIVRSSVVNRFTLRTIAMTLLAVTLVACASTPAVEELLPATLPVPDRAGLANWLEAADAGNATDTPTTFFIQMADPQLGFYGSPLWLALIGKTWDDDNFARDAKLFETAMAHANELAPAFVVICGDLIHRPGYAAQIAEFKRIAAGLDREIPLHLVAGNHDVENRPTKASQLAYREAFGLDWYSFRHGDVYGIVLNSQLIDARDEVPEEADQQLAWLREELVRAKASGAGHILIFQHHPYFLKSKDESKNYYNVALEDREVYLQLFAEAGVQAVFAGHYHRNAYGRDGDLEMVTTGPVGRPLGDDPSGFRIVKVSKDSIEHRYYSIENE